MSEVMLNGFCYAVRNFARVALRLHCRADRGTANRAAAQGVAKEKEGTMTDIVEDKTQYCLSCASLAARLAEATTEMFLVRGLLSEARHMIRYNLCHDGPRALVALIDAALDTNGAANRVTSTIADKPAAECPERATVADRRQEDGCS